MPHTLVTGANSFVAAHIIQALINAGHTVTGSVRRASAGEAVLGLHPEWKDHVDFVEVEDYAVEGVFDDIFKNKDFTYVIHVAAPFAVTSTDTEYERDFLLPGVGGYVSTLLSS
jgi:nucleoside-diphosphate-sugar epimerase